MENFRSMSCREGRNSMQIMENYNNNNTTNNKNTSNNVGPPTSMQDLRSYSTSYASYMQVHPQPCNNKDSKSNNNTNNNSISNYKKSKGSGSSSSTKGWSLSDPEIQRKKRVVSYKVYAVQGKMKGSFRKSFKWVKNTCSHVVHGFW